jgi:hypothetical protein
MDAQTPRSRIRRRTAIWLAVATAISCGVIGLVVLVIDSPASLGPSAAGQCTIGYASTDARATFVGKGAGTMCNGWHAADANWTSAGAAPSGDTSVCTGRNGALSWTVLDDGQQTQGKNACGTLVNWARGGTLDIP